MIIVVGGEKGGPGKTTTAINFAVTRQKEKGNLLLVDADPQPHSTWWCWERESQNVMPRIASIQKTGEGIRKELLALNEKFTDIVVDTGGRDTAEFRGSLLSAHLALIPVYPGRFDEWNLKKLNKLVGELKPANPTLRVLLFLSRTLTLDGDSEAKNTIQNILDCEFEHLGLAKTILRQRKAYKQMGEQGKSIIEVGIDPKAEAEFMDLYKEVLGGY